MQKYSTYTRRASGTIAIHGVTAEQVFAICAIAEDEIDWAIEEEGRCDGVVVDGAEVIDVTIVPLWQPDPGPWKSE